MYKMLTVFLLLNLNPAYSECPADTTPQSTCFGYDIAAESGYLIVGAPATNSLNGKVYSYDFRSGDINANIELDINKNQHRGSEASPNYGRSVAISENGNVVATNGSINDANSGGAFMFHINPVDPFESSSWYQWSNRDVGGTSGGSMCGGSIDTSENITVVGCTGQPGRVGVFEKSLGGERAWNERIQLMPTVVNYIEPDGIGYGNQVTTSDDWIAVSENCKPGAGATTCDSYVYLYQKDKNGSDKWGLSQTITVGSPQVPQNDRQLVKISLSMRGDWLAIGRATEDYGEASVLVYKRNRRSWSLEDELVMPGPDLGPDHSYGYNVVVSDNSRIIVSARGTYPMAPAETSMIVVFEKVRNDWRLENVLFPNTRDINLSVASSGEFIFAGDSNAEIVVPFKNESGNWVKRAPIAKP